MKIVQITDTHLSPGKRHFNGNWEPLLAWIRQTGADLVVHTGDLTIDGADVEEDIAFSLELMRQLPVPMLMVPGNHDVGHTKQSRQPVDPVRLERWRRMAGADYWVSDHENWRLIGLNSLLFGHGDDEEDAQFAWLEQALATRDGRRVAFFMHQPLFVDAPHEADTGYWGIQPGPRQRLFDLMAQNDVALVASGHLHWAWKGSFRDTSIVWAPSAAFIIDALEREMPGERVVGAVIHTLGEDVHSEIAVLPQLVPYVIDEVIHEVYPHVVATTAPEAAE